MFHGSINSTCEGCTCQVSLASCSSSASRPKKAVLRKQSCRQPGKKGMQTAFPAEHCRLPSSRSLTTTGYKKSESSPAHKECRLSKTLDLMVLGHVLYDGECGEGRNESQFPTSQEYLLKQDLLLCVISIPASRRVPSTRLIYVQIQFSHILFSELEVVQVGILFNTCGSHRFGKRYKALRMVSMQSKLEGQGATVAPHRFTIAGLTF
jgi:hypothetical protein